MTNRNEKTQRDKYKPRREGVVRGRARKSARVDSTPRGYIANERDRAPEAAAAERDPYLSPSNAGEPPTIRDLAAERDPPLDSRSDAHHCRVCAGPCRASHWGCAICHPEYRPGG